MGTFQYGTETFRIDDATLTHLAAIIAAKLRRGEPFLLTCYGDESRESLWLHGASTLMFRYDDAVAVPLDKARLEAMIRETHRPSGLRIDTTPALAPAAAVAA